MQHTVRLLVAAGLTLSGAWCQAQPIPLNPPQPQFTDPEVSRLQREVRNPRHISALLQARGLLSTNPERAIDTLQPLLDTPEDSPFSDQGGYSVKDQAEELLRSAGTEILDQYERRFAATAQAILNDAPTQRRAEALREVARRFGLTSVGLDALQRLTIMAVDAGDSSSAGRFCQRLKRDPRSAAFEPRLSLIQAWSQVRSGRSAQAEQTLAALRDANPGPLVLDGQNIPWFQSADAIDRWLSGLFPAVGNPDDAEGLPYWELAHGDLLRNAASAAAPPVLDDGWSYPLVDEHDDYVRPDNILQTLSILKDLDEKLRTAMQSTPVAEPLLLRNMLIVSGLGSLKALSLESGQLVWSSVPVDDTLARLFADTEPQLVEGKQELLRLLAAQRAFRDLVHTSLSSDGRRVYRVGQGGLVGSPMVNMMGAASIRGTDPLIPRLYNSLQAYEVSGGKLRWEKGGPPRMVLEEEDRLRAESDLVGAFFLSAPIPWSGQLLCLIEQGNQIELAALEPESGEPLWIQPLLNSDPLENLQNAPDRRFAGVSAALDGSTLIAVLGNGTVAAYDVALRRCLWTYTYKYPDRPDRTLAWMRRLPQRGGENLTDTLLATNQWQDPRTIVTGSRVLVTPVDDDSLDCIDAATGELLWSHPRDGGLYLAAAHRDMALVVARAELRGVQLANGETAWRLPIPTPSGRGVRRGSHYTLPLSTGEILTVNLSSGQVLARTELASGRPVGNLVAAPGMLLTQTASEVRAFRTESSILSEMQQKLAGNPKEGAALRIRGELELHRGQTEAGERDLMAAVEAGNRPAARSLAWSLLAGLQRDFDAYHPRFEEIRTLTNDPSLLAQAWMSAAEGLRLRGESIPAFVALVQSSEHIDDNSNRLLERRGSLRVRERNQMQAIIQELWESFSASEQEQAATAVREQLASLPANAPEFDRALAVLPAEAAPRRLQLERIARGGLKPLAAEQQLVELRRSSDPELAARADLLLIRSLIEEGRAPLPYGILASVNGPLANVAVDEQQTAEQALSELLRNPETAERLQRRRWPDVKPTVEPLTEVAGVFDYTATASVSGQALDLLEGWVFANDASSASVVAFDSNGMFRWRESIPVRAQGPIDPRISVHGRLLLLEAPDSFRILDAFSGQTLQTVSLFDLQSDMFGGRIIPRAGSMRPPNNRPVSPLTSRFVAFLEAPRFRVSAPTDFDARLVVIEPLTRREIWSRPARVGQEVLADDEFVVVQSATGELQPYRAIDGDELPTTRVPEGWAADREFRVGVRRLISRRQGDAVELGMFHAATGRIEWRLTVPLHTFRSLLDSRELVIHRPDGRLSIHSLATGEERISAQLDPDPDIKTIGILSDARRLYVATSSVSTSSTIPMARFLARGPLYAIDRQTGKVLWKREITGRHMDLRQPGNWPFLILASSLTVITENNTESARPDRRMATSLLLLNRATGEVIYDAELPIREAPRGWKADPAAGQIALRFGEAGVRLNFPQEEAAAGPSGEPGPPPPPVAEPIN